MGPADQPVWALDCSGVSDHVCVCVMVYRCVWVRPTSRSGLWTAPACLTMCVCVCLMVYRCVWVRPTSRSGLWTVPVCRGGGAASSSSPWWAPTGRRPAASPQTGWPSVPAPSGPDHGAPGWSTAGWRRTSSGAACPAPPDTSQVSDTSSDTSQVSDTSSDTSQVSDTSSDTSQVSDTSSDTSQVSDTSSDTSQVSDTSSDTSQVSDTSSDTSQVSDTSQLWTVSVSGELWVVHRGVLTVTVTVPAVSVSGELWVVHRGDIYTLHDQVLRPGRRVEPRVTDRPPSSPSAAADDTTADTEDHDWEMVTY